MAGSTRSNLDRQTFRITVGVPKAADRTGCRATVIKNYVEPHSGPADVRFLLIKKMENPLINRFFIDKELEFQHKIV